MGTCNPNPIGQEREAGTGSNVKGVGQTLRNCGGAQAKCRTSEGGSPETPPRCGDPGEGRSATHTQLCGHSSLSRSSALAKALHSRLGMPEGRYLQNQASQTGPGSVAARTPASVWAGRDWASARLTLTLSLCQAQRGQTTLPFNAPVSFSGGKGPRLPCWPSARLVPLGASG